MASSEHEANKQHYYETLGNLPGAIRAMEEFAPDAFDGYTAMRKYIYRTPETGGALDLKTKELIYVLLDVICSNLDGAKNHLDAAMRAGLTLPELTEGCMQVMAVFGIQTWGKTGYHVCDYARDELARAGKRNGRARGAGRGAEKAPAASRPARKRAP